MRHRSSAAGIREPLTQAAIDRRGDLIRNRYGSMKSDDPLPVDASHLAPDMTVPEIIMPPGMKPFLLEA
jgi:hypothetical protein